MPFSRERSEREKWGGMIFAFFGRLCRPKNAKIIFIQGFFHGVIRHSNFGTLLFTRYCGFVSLVL